MSSFNSRFGITAVLATAVLVASQPVSAESRFGPSGAEQSVSSLLAVEMARAMPVAMARRALVRSASGTVTTAIHAFDLDSLKAADFGDEPARPDLR